MIKPVSHKITLSLKLKNSLGVSVPKSRLNHYIV
jgi:hypothetical protein